MDGLKQKSLGHSFLSQQWPLLFANFSVKSCWNVFKTKQHLLPRQPDFVCPFPCFEPIGAFSMPPAHAAPRLSTRREQGALRKPPRPSHANLSRVGKKACHHFPCCWAVPRWRMLATNRLETCFGFAWIPKKDHGLCVTTMKIDNRDLHLNSRFNAWSRISVLYVVGINKPSHILEPISPGPLPKLHRFSKKLSDSMPCALRACIFMYPRMDLREHPISDIQWCFLWNPRMSTHGKKMQKPSWLVFPGSQPRGGFMKLTFRGPILEISPVPMENHPFFIGKSSDMGHVPELLVYWRTSNKDLDITEIHEAGSFLACRGAYNPFSEAGKYLFIYFLIYLFIPSFTR